MKMPTKYLTPPNAIYILCHFVLILGGFLLVYLSNANSVLFAVGASIAAAGLSGWMILGYVIASDTMRKRLDIVLKFGITNAFDGRSVVIRKEYEDRLVRARERIDIMGFGLSSLREDFTREFGKWKQRARIRILLLDPEFPNADCSYALQRDKEEKTPVGQIANHVKQFVADIGNIATQHGSLQVRLYRCLPTLNIFRIDDELFWGPYLMGEPSRNCPTFLVRRGG